MDYKKIIDYKITKLCNIYNNKGVQINELVNNIYNDIYTEINVYKKDKYIVAELCFIENYDEIMMTYIYEEEKLIRVEELVNKSKIILWDRNNRINNLLDSIIVYMQKIYTEKDIKKALKTLPDELKTELENRTELENSAV